MPGSQVVSSVSWSPCGSSFVVLWKDQSLRIIEPRTGNSVLVNVVVVHLILLLLKI